VSIALRKNTVAALASPAFAPDATTCEELSFEKPAPASRDHRTFAPRSDEELDPMESTHARVELTLSDNPRVAGAIVPLTAEVAVGDIDATCTLTRDGTVTLTVWVRLLEDPRCATAAREIIALPITIASSESRSLSIYRASSYREPQLSDSLILG
jgi:hypothetical protein